MSDDAAPYETPFIQPTHGYVENHAGHYVADVILPAWLQEYPAMNQAVVMTRAGLLAVNVPRLVQWFCNNFPSYLDFVDGAALERFLLIANLSRDGWSGPQLVRGSRYRVLDAERTAQALWAAGGNPFADKPKRPLDPADVDWSSVPIRNS